MSVYTRGFGVLQAPSLFSGCCLSLFPILKKVWKSITVSCVSDSIGPWKQLNCFRTTVAVVYTGSCSVEF